MNQPTKQRIATRAAILRDGKVLVIREAPTYVNGNRHGFYDLPGGKVELGESIRDCLHREMLEEVGVDVEIDEPFYVGEWTPVVQGELLQIIAVFFICKPLSTEIKLSQDHDDYQWVGLNDIQNIPLTDPIPESIQRLIALGLLS